MSLLDLQRRIAESGRIRIGRKVDGGRPAKLDTFRLTTADRQRIEQAAEVYGGTPAQWVAPAGKQWELITERDSLDVIVPPSDLAFSQAWEMWSAGGCQRRCDGVEEQISGGPCRCDPEKRECDIHTRLSVMLRDLPGLGVWRLDTQGYYAAVELASAVEIIQLAAGRGALLPARLRLEQRSAKRPDAKGKPQTLRFAVPVLDIEMTPAQLLGGGAQPIALADATRPKLTPVPQLALPAPSIAEQSAPPPERSKRSNAAPEIPSSGRQRRARAAAPEAGTEQELGEDAPVETPSSAEAEAGSTPATDASPAPAARPRRSQDAIVEDDPEYWQKRVHAAARERGLKHDALRTIAAAVLGIEHGDVAKFSTKDMVAYEFRAVDALLRSLPSKLTGDDDEGDLSAISEWVWPRAKAKGLDAWPAIDAVATAVTGQHPDALGVADWIAFTVRLGAGEYDAEPKASKAS